MKRFKNIVTALIALAVVATLTVSVCAAGTPDCFIGSSTVKNVVEVTNYVNESKDCTAKLAVTNWLDKDDLTPAEKETFSKAYEDLSKYKTPAEASKDLEKLLASKKIAASNTAISTFFDVTCNDCVNHDDHGIFTLTLKSQNFGSFLGLLTYQNGQWILLDSNYDSKTGSLTFNSKNLGVMAIVVQKPDSPKTGDNTLALWGAVLAVAVAGAFVTVVSAKKKETI